MSVHEHRKTAGEVAVSIHIVVVSSSRTLSTDKSGSFLLETLEHAGHRVLGRRVVPDDLQQIQAVVSELRADPLTQCILFTGGTGISARDCTSEALNPLFTRKLPGFGELFRMLSYAEIGAAAMMSRATAGFVGDTVIFALPGSRAACALALEKLIVPELPHLVWERQKETADLPAQLPPTRTVSIEQVIAESTQLPAEQTEIGWKRALLELGSEDIPNTWEDLPQPIESLSPVIDVLHQAGQRKMVQLPNGKRYALFGFPDLIRSSSKVLAVAWGDPLAEVVALHRYPSYAGTCIDGDRGVLPSRAASVAEVCEATVGRTPVDESGPLFAVQGDAVCYERGGVVYRFDGRKESSMGTQKQALASLVLHWSNK